MSYELTFEQIQRCKRVFDNNKSNPLNDRDDIRLPYRKFNTSFRRIRFYYYSKRIKFNYDRIRYGS